MNEEKIGMCIIGLGRAGRFHLTSINQIDACELVYVVDPLLSEEDDFVRNNSFFLTKDIEEVLNDEKVDAVIVSTPTEYHYDYICRSLNAGKHVFTEKPLGKSNEEIEYCFDLAASKELCLFLGFQRRYDYNFNELKRRITEIGEVRTVKMSSRDNPKPSIEYLSISGNIFHDMLIHDFDMLNFLFGYQRPESVYAIGHCYDLEIAALGDYDTVLVTIKYPNGMICAVDTSRTAEYGYDQRIELFAEKGMAIAENVRNTTVQVHNNSGMHVSPINYSFPQRYLESYKLEMIDFLNGIQNGILVNVPKEECLLSNQIADAAYESIRGNVAVEIN